jgi:putative redox protein
MDIMIDFPGGQRVDAHFGPFTVQTDQSPSTSSPSPFNVFLSSIGTCAGFYVLRFCQQRQLPVEGISILERISTNHETKLVEKIDIEIRVPPTFPEKYHEALVKTAELCAVKKALENPPQFNTYTTVIG